MINFLKGGHLLNLFLVMIAVVILLSIVLSKISNRIGIPALLLYIILGIIFTHPSLLNIQFQDFQLVENIAIIALIFIMFYGGFNTRWQEAKNVAKPSIVLASLGVVLTALVTGLGVYWLLGLSWQESFLIGSVLSSTDAASVFSIIRSKKLSLRHHTASLLELESGSNDPASYLMTIVALQIMQSNIDGPKIVLDIIIQIGLACLLGWLIQVVALYIYQRVQWIAGSGSDTLFIFGLAVLTYALTSYLNGNGYLAVYIFGILLGNSPISNKTNLVFFFDGFTKLMQMMLFFSLGFLSNPDLIRANFLTGFIVFLIMTILARPLVVTGIMKLFKAPTQQIQLVAFAGLRGAASIAFAIMAHNQLTSLTLDIFHIVFVVVLFSILIQGALLAWLAIKLDMTDPLGDPLKSFTDYAEERPIEFVTFEIKDSENIWANKKIKDLNIQNDLLLVLIQREQDYLIPGGNTLIQVGDRIVCIAKSFDNANDFQLKEFTVTEDSEYLNVKVSELETANRLFVLIKRQDQYIIPDGQYSLILDDEVIYIENFTEKTLNIIEE